MRRKTFVLLLLLVSVVSCLYNSALAQESPHGRWFVDPTGAATSAFLFDPPPAGFDPLTASEADLLSYGFPPRPSPGDESRYARWKRMASLTRIRPEVTFSTISFGPARGLKQVGDATASTDNWSGYVLTAKSGTFAKNPTYVVGQWSMPSVSEPACDSMSDYAAQWVGFDGWNPSDNEVLQAGTDSAAYCSGGTTTASYYAWFEWYPNNATFVNLPFHQGDVAIIQVEYFPSGKPGQGWFQIGNESTSSGVSGYFNPPAGTKYVGDSVEWIVERPLISGSLSDLPDYSTTIFSDVYAENGTEYTPNGPVPPGGAIYNVTMTCPLWNPSSACPTTTNISEVSLQVEGEQYQYLTFNPLPPAK